MMHPSSRGWLTNNPFVENTMTTISFELRLIYDFRIRR